MGHLRSLQIVVQRRRVRALLHDVDGQGISERRTHTITRRQYWSPCPNYVWHIDGLHKLIRWKFVIHGSVDGFSRLIIFLNCSLDNRASTVLNQFQEAVQLFGWPLHVRTDLGGENTGIWRAMTEHHHSDNAVIVDPLSTMKELRGCGEILTELCHHSLGNNSSLLKLKGY